MTESADSVLILGAASDIGRAIARAYAATGRPIVLAARQVERLAADAQDLRLRSGVAVRLVEFDILETGGIEGFLDRLGDLPGTAILVVGLLGDQIAARHDPIAADRIMRTNYLGPALVLAALADRMERRGRGTLIGISSVAGERGRASNYVYGSAKAGLTAFLSGLRHRFAQGPVRVITVKPGFVRTAMTAGMDLSPLLTAEPAEVAAAILAADQRGRRVVYVRPIWAVVMAIIRLLPEAVFLRMKV